MKLVAQGEEVQSLTKAEDLFQEKEKGEVRLYLQRPLSEAGLVKLRQSIKAKGGVLVGEIRQAGTVISIPFRKEMPFLLILVPLLAGLGVVGWQILKPETIGGGLLVGAGIVLLAVVILSLSENKGTTRGGFYATR